MEQNTMISMTLTLEVPVFDLGISKQTGLTVLAADVNGCKRILGRGRSKQAALKNLRDELTKQLNKNFW